MSKVLFLCLLFFFSEGKADEFDKKTELTLGNNSFNKFSYYEPIYFAFGKNDLKLQFSGKYRMAKSFNLYLGYTQTMFWKIYVTSQPFADINYYPEVFYRLVDDHSSSLKSMDFGFVHSSNGKDGSLSRSFNRLYLKTNLSTKIKRHSLISELKFYDIITSEENNRDIKKYLGYWNFNFYFTHLLVHQKDRLDLELKLFAGENVINLNKGGRSIGLVYTLDSANFNPSFYVQYFSGHSENLLNYNKYSEQVRLGLLLFL